MVSPGVKAYPKDHVSVCAGSPTSGIGFLRSKKGGHTWLVSTSHNVVPIVKQPQSPYFIEQGLFLQLLQPPFVAIMLQIKAGILNTNSGDYHIGACCIHVHGKQPNTCLKEKKNGPNMQK